MCEGTLKGARSPGDAPDFSGKRVLVVGLGRFSGGVATVRFLLARGARVKVTDLKGPDEVESPLDELKDTPVEYRLGGHADEDFAETDYVIRSPAVPPDSRFLRISRARGIPVETETSLFFRLCPARIVGVTGSNGKSTTTALIAAMLEHGSRRVWLGGNIGKCLIDRVGDIGSDDLVVLELSSFQLEDLERIRLSPWIAVVTNLSPNHLDRHGDVPSYYAAKKVIVTYQRPGDWKVLAADDPVLATWADAGAARAASFSLAHSVAEGAFLEGDDLALAGAGETEVFARCSDLNIPGRHNVANALAAAAAAHLAGASPAHIRDGIRQFKGLPHRLEFVGTLAGVACYNDSIATTPESAVAALESFEAPVVLIAGGYDKHVDLSGFAEQAARRARAVFTIGATGAAVARLVRDACGEDCASPRVENARTLERACAGAIAEAIPGDVILLSPACASYDQFVNFEERGERFRELVKSSEGFVAAPVKD